jgi:hypothetical protein
MRGNISSQKNFEGITEEKARLFLQEFLSSSILRNAATTGILLDTTHRLIEKNIKSQKLNESFKALVDKSLLDPSNEISKSLEFTNNSNLINLENSVTEPLWTETLAWTHPQPTFPKFSLALRSDPSTRRIWYALATAHDLEAHDKMTEENLYHQIFASHFGHLAIIFYGHQVIYFMSHGKVILNSGLLTLLKSNL